VLARQISSFQATWRVEQVRKRCFVRPGLLLGGLRRPLAYRNRILIRTCLCITTVLFTFACSHTPTKGVYQEIVCCAMQQSHMGLLAISKAVSTEKSSFVPQKVHMGLITWSFEIVRSWTRGWPRGGDFNAGPPGPRLLFGTGPQAPIKTHIKDFR